MHGLKTIILHDSYYRGLRTRISCEGHTNNTGDNGSGKTSALTLIPIFYGKEPDSLIERAGDKAKFVDYYLPSRQSMVIFEYSRQTGLCCAVMYRKREGSFAYRFIQGEADKTLFAEEMESLYDSGLDANTLLRHELPKYGINVSKQIDRIIDYRAIIQNDTTRLKHRSQSGISFRQETLDFCLGDATSHMKHIEALTSVVLKQDRLLKQFKIMIVDSFLENQISIGTLPYHRKDVALIQDLKSLQAFVGHQTKINEVISDYQALNAMWSTIKGYRQQIALKIEEWHQETQQHNEALITLKRDMDEKKGVYGKQYGALSSKISGYMAQQQQAEKDIEHLLKRKREWDQHDILIKKEALEHLPQLIESRETENAHYLKLCNAVKKQQEQHDAEKKKAQYDAQQHVATENARQLHLTTEFQQKETEHNTHLNTLRDAKDQAIDTYRQQRDKEQEVLNATVIEAMVKVKTAQQPTVDEKSESEQLEQDRKAGSDSLEQAKADYQLCFEKSTENKHNRQEAEEVHQKQRKRCDSLREQQKECSRQLYPKDNTLLAYLRASEMGWHDTIGKIIQPSLLQRTDLSPLFDDINSEQGQQQGQQTLYGLSLALDTVSYCNAARSEDELHQMRKDLNIKIENAEDDLKQQASTLQKLNMGVKKDNDTLSLAKHREVTLEAKLIQIERFIEAFKVKVDIQGKERETLAKDDLNTVEEQVNVFKDETKHNIQHITQQYKTQDSQKKSEWQEAKRNHNQQLDSVKKTINLINNNVNQRLEELESEFMRLLENKAIDTKTLTTAQNRKDEAKNKVKRVREYKRVVDDYHDWQDTRWSRKPEWENNIIQCDDMIGKLTKQRTSQQKSYEAYLEKNSNEQKQQSKRLIDITKSSERGQTIISTADNALRVVAMDLEADLQNLPDSPQLLLQQADSLLKEEQGSKDRIIKVVREVIRIIDNGHTDSQIYELWQALHAERKRLSLHSELSPEFDLESIQDIQQLNEQGVSQIQRGLLENITAIGSRIYRYHETLEVLNKKVNTISRRLEKNINTEHQFPAISNIRVNLISKISELDLWKDLKLFKQQWEQWDEEGNTSLPNADFIKALADVSQVMKHSNIDNNLYSLVDLEISLTENGRVVPIRTDNDLKNASSTGISLLAVIVVFCGMTRYLCEDNTICIHWPLDEIGRLSSSNISLLFKMMDAHNIALFCAQPNPSAVLNRYFIHKNELNNKTGVRQYLPRIQQKKSNPLLANKAIRQAQNNGEVGNETTVL
jgi:hypothetical protein